MKEKHPTLRGVFWMLGAQLFFVTGWTSIKYLGQRLPLFEIVFFRSFIGFLLLIPTTYITQGTFRGKNWKNIFLRSLTGFLAMMMAFHAVINMHIGNVATLLNTLPIFVAILAPLMLKERFRPIHFLFIVVAFAGITLIIKPNIGIFKSASIYALGAGFMYALAVIYIRKMRTTDSVYTITLYFVFFVAVASAPLAFRHFVRPTLREGIYLLVIGTALTCAQLFVTRAFHHTKAAIVAPFGYFSVIGSYVAGLLFFAELPDAWSFAGAAVIVASGIGIILTTPRPRADQDAAPFVKT